MNTQNNTVTAPNGAQVVNGSTKASMTDLVTLAIRKGKDANFVANAVSLMTTDELMAKLTAMPDANVAKRVQVPVVPTAPQVFATPADEIAFLKAEIARKTEENKRTPQKLLCRVSEKKAVSIYGLGRFPVTLYKAQMRRLLAAKEVIEAFIVANEAALESKE